MKSKLLITALCLFGGLLFSNKTLAQTTIFDIGPDLSQHASSSSGDWQVTVTQTGALTYNVSIVAAGNLLNSPLLPAPTGAGESVEFSFQQGSFSVAQTGGPGKATGGNNWTESTETGYEEYWQGGVLGVANPGDVFIATDGSNVFNGSVTVANPVTDVTVRVVDDGTGGPWEGYSVLTPEASSLALLVPGLIPLGVVLRKRRRNSDTS